MVKPHRHSYSGLMRHPVFGLYDEDGKLIATVRANTAMTARHIFHKHLSYDEIFRGEKVKKI